MKQDINLTNPMGYLAEEDRYFFAEQEPGFRLNIIGTGMMGLEHMRVTRLEGRARIHGLYDTAPRSLEAGRRQFRELYPGEEAVTYDDLASCCNDPAADALIICTPNYTHLEVLRTALGSGKPILLEKPMVTTIEDAVELRTLVQDYPAVFQVGLQYRYKPIYMEARHEALNSGSIGRIRQVSLTEHRIPFLDKVGQWNKFSRYSGGTLVEKCCHYFDLMNLFAGGNAVSVYGSGSQAVNFVDFEYGGETSDILDNASVIVTYDNGVTGSFQLNMFQPMFYEELVLCGEGGRIKTWEMADSLDTTRATTHFELHRGEQGHSLISQPVYPAPIQDSGHSGATFIEHRNFVNRLIDPDDRSDMATLEEGFRSVVIGAAAERSVHTGEVVDIAALLSDNR